MALRTKIIDRKYADGALAAFTALLTVRYERVNACRIQEGSQRVVGTLTYHNPLWEVITESTTTTVLHDYPKRECVSSKGTADQMDRFRAEYEGVVALRTPAIQFPMTSFGIPGMKLAEKRFKLIIWCAADDSTVHEYYENGKKL